MADYSQHKPASAKRLAELAKMTGAAFYEKPHTEAEIVDNYRLDHLYKNAFRDGKGQFFTVVSSDDAGVPEVVEAEHPGVSRNKIKTRLTFIKSEEGGYIKDIEIKRFKYYAKKGYVEQEEERICFSFPFFVGLVGFLQSIASLNLNDITERRIPLVNGPALDDETIRQFWTFASTEQGQDLIREAVKNGQVTGSDIVNIGYRKSQLEVFERLMESAEAVQEYRTTNNIKKAGDEAVWQHFFEANTWIFGYGLNFVFNEPLEGERLEAAVRGSDLAGAGKKPDGVLKTAGIINSLCLVEIKTPNAALLDTKQYRDECWKASDEVSGGISQAQKTTQKTLENVALSPVLRPKDDDGTPTGEVIYSYRPKSYLLIGKLSEFITPTGVNTEKYASFELLRRNTTQPEIITFDELLERARFIVSNSGESAPAKEKETPVAEAKSWDGIDPEDIPF